MYIVFLSWSAREGRRSVSYRSKENVCRATYDELEGRRYPLMAARILGEPLIMFFISGSLLTRSSTARVT